MSDIIIGGLQKITLLDYPDKVAATVFLQGCNMRCRFCHNASLVSGLYESIGRDELMRFLKRRIGLLDGVCITGGEPTLYGEGLLRLVSDIKELGYLVKLDTNGTSPTVVRELIDRSLIDYVAMDIKTRITYPDYERICGRFIEIKNVLETVHLLMEGRIGYEFRTTLVREFHGLAQIADISNSIAGARAYYLQHFVDSGDLIDGEGLHEVEKEEALRFAAEAQKLVPTFLRGI